MTSPRHHIVDESHNLPRRIDRMVVGTKVIMRGKRPHRSVEAGQHGQLASEAGVLYHDQK